MPVAAVGPGGNPNVSSGSQMATDGISGGANTTALRWPSVSVTTALRPTSLPVPAVVGSAIIGGIACTTSLLPPIRSSYCASGGSCVTSSRMIFPASMAEPPPRATIESASPRR